MNVKLQRNNPCYKCADRSAICHSVCIKYKEWSDKVTEQREFYRKQREDKRKTYPSSIDKVKK